MWPIRPNVSIYLCKPYHWKSDTHEIFQYLFETILGFLLPFTFILFCYISVICRLRSAMFQRKGRGNALILIIIAAFTVFWLPYHLINILQVSNTSHCMIILISHCYSLHHVTSQHHMITCPWKNIQIQPCE